MTITISPETQKLLEDQLRAGRYESADELLHAALAALDAQAPEEIDPDTRAAIDRAEESIAQGKVHDWKDVRQQVKATLSGK